MHPTFSVVIPTYNQAELLKDALASVINQTFSDFDIWVVNNFSTDSTLDVIRALGDPRINVINYKNHGNIGASRNIGINESTGRFVAFLDSDDIWYKNKLDVISQAFEGHPEASIICHSQMMFQDNVQSGRLEFGPPSKYKGHLYDYWIRHGNPLPPSAVVASRQSLTNIGGFTEDSLFLTVEDTDLWLRLAKTYQFIFLPVVLGEYRISTKSMSRNTSTHLSGAINLLEEHWSSYRPGKRSVVDKIAIRHQQANAYFGAGRSCHQSGSFTDSLKYFASALKLYPFHLRSILAITLLFISTGIGRTWSIRVSNSLWALMTKRKKH